MPALEANFSLASMLAEAAALEQSGKVVDAIRLLHVANRQNPNGDIERMLVRLRYEGFQKTAVRPALVPRAPESIPKHPTVGLPSLAASELTAARLRSAIDGSGVLYVPRLVDGRQAKCLRDAIDKALDARLAVIGKRANNDTFRWYEEVSRLSTKRTFRKDRGVLGADSPRGLFLLMETFYEIGVDRLLTEYFAEAPGLSIEKCTLRRANPTQAGSWHQDGAFLGTDIRALNMWITLSDCGRNAPTLEIVPCRVDYVLPTGCFFDWDVKPETIAAEIPDVAPVALELREGDALFFDHLFLHRTYWTQAMTEPRYAVENWFFAPSAYPAKGYGLLV